MSNLPEGTTTPEVQWEALRRRAGMPGSSASIGAERAGALSPENPLAQEGLVQGAAVPGGASGQPSDMATQRLGQDKGEARTIIDALVQRLRGLTKQEAAPAVPAL